MLFKRKKPYTFVDAYQVFPERVGQPVKILRRFVVHEPCEVYSPLGEWAYEIQLPDGRIGMAYPEELDRPINEFIPWA